MPLHRDIQKQIGGTVVTYSAKTSGSVFRLEVVILALDLHLTYSRSINRVHQDKTFRIGEELIEYTSASKLRQRVWHYSYQQFKNRFEAAV